jgi:unsaturated rhamnogalacturonyl hydrolase
MYGPELETTKKEPLVSSGIDVWAKRVPRLLVNEWYMTDDYHQDHGDGADYYSVGKSRGCGGLGIWDKDKLSVSHNFTTSRVLASGPIRLVFELDYAPWDAGGGTKVSETKRVTLDAGSFFNRFESTFTTKRAPLPVALGIAKHRGATEVADAATASIRVWEPVENGKNGYLGCAVVLGSGVAGVEKQTDDNYLFVTNAKPGEPLRYYVGSTWDRAGHVANAEAWGETTRQLAARIAAPLKVALAAGPGATAVAAPTTAKPAL